ncbi:Flp pilus assembly protein CpaB [Paraburkholderia phymatum]|uniref:Flp pilus assembly protein CpaB n=1 Tax=Paraburkholderia phymatum (strain DSM 17167 / CIP 108236 / LMG 21445 / STM815) TaxID=391038 RepID=B2JQB8_PARP8|nr:Flp pilus assembly protein CpaB [Paraburkholderia phymatum]ACC73459.1 Flp pilus assembly protein CpaB [Paraburkholderia phymatum STM815]
MFRKIKFHSLLGNAWLLLLAAVLTAGALTWFVYRYLGEREAHVRAEVAGKLALRGIEVVVPRRDVPAGTPLSSDAFVSREIAADLVYDDMVRVDAFDAFRKAKLVRAVMHGRPLRTSDFDAPRGRDFSDMLPAGQRALTFEIDAVNSTASMLRPGNRVDMYWVGTQAYASAGERKAVRLLLPGVLVLATGRSVNARDAGDVDEPASASRYDTVTMQVPAADAPRIVLAQKMGTLRLILRNAADDDDIAASPVELTEGDVFGAQLATRAASVEVIAGGGSGAATASVAQVAPMPSGDTANPRERGPEDSVPAPASRTLSDSAAVIAKQLQQHAKRRGNQD